MIGPLKNFLNQGLSPSKLALCLALGLTLGTFPVLGVTTILCALIALILKLNLPVIQFTNYLVCPLQILLLAPYYYFGDLLFNAQQQLDLGTLKTMMIENTHKEMITMVFESTLYAVIAWLLISPLALVLLYTGLKPALVRLDVKPSRIKFLRH